MNGKKFLIGVLIIAVAFGCGWALQKFLEQRNKEKLEQEEKLAMEKKLEPVYYLQEMAFEDFVGHKEKYEQWTIDSLMAFDVKDFTGVPYIKDHYEEGLDILAKTIQYCKRTNDTENLQLARQAFTKWHGWQKKIYPAIREKFARVYEKDIRKKGFRLKVKGTRLWFINPNKTLLWKYHDGIEWDAYPEAKKAGFTGFVWTTAYPKELEAYTLR